MDYLSSERGHENFLWYIILILIGTLTLMNSYL
jgi:hypothetical protein